MLGAFDFFKLVINKLDGYYEGDSNLARQKCSSILKFVENQSTLIAFFRINPSFQVKVFFAILCKAPNDPDF